MRKTFKKSKKHQIEEDKDREDILLICLLVNIIWFIFILLE